MTERVVPDETSPGAYYVRFGLSAQSWVDPAHPDVLAFEYVSNISVVLDATVMQVPVGEPLRLVHVGGGGMSIPRWVAWRRARTAQIVLEPDAALVAEVREKIPLPSRVGIKVREIDGRAGVAAMPDDYADAVIVDAFNEHGQVPGCFATQEFLAELGRVTRGMALVIFNVTDTVPFQWTKRIVAGLSERFPHVAVGAEVAVFKGRRFGNVLLAAAAQPLPMGVIRKQARTLPFSYRWLSEDAVAEWQGGLTPYRDHATYDSPMPPRSGHYFA